MTRISKYLLVGLIVSTLFSCGSDSDDPIEEMNVSPEVATSLDDLNLTAGFQSTTVSLASAFTDADGDDLNFSATSSPSSVITVAVSGSNLTINEVSAGNALVTITASDGNGGNASTDFTVTIMEESTECSNDNSINLQNTTCDNTPTEDNEYTETLEVNDIRKIVTNRVPDHDYGNQIANLGVMSLVSTTETFTFTADPSLAMSTTGILDENNRPAYDYGIALNGVPIDPAPAEPFIFTVDNPGGSNDGEYNWDWVFEPNNNRTAVGLDCNTAHLQPTDNNTKGLIHYHGDMVVYANSLLAGLGDGTTEPTDAVQVGWASDGFPIVYKYGPNSGGTDVVLLESSYQLKDGERPGDGMTEPCGEYNGKYTNDYEFVSESGDLDECNGISRSITLTTPAGGSETFSYFYVITDEFPVIGRCLSGTPDEDFSKMP
ncbi:YHYH protein [Ekhidna sp. To15]|uniref:YHYH protein n=1 Tax=Ekhidna sp. To15 TaxID=3395267 RepID=UPI003F527184